MPVPGAPPGQPGADVAVGAGGDTSSTSTAALTGLRCSTCPSEEADEASVAASESEVEARATASDGGHPARLRRLSTVAQLGEERLWRLDTEFFTSSDSHDGMRLQMQHMGRSQAVVLRLLNSTYTDVFVAITVMANFALVCIEVDYRAHLVSASLAGREVPAWIRISSDCCFALFWVELLLRIFAERQQWPRSKWNLIDAVTCLCGSVEYIVLILGLDLSSVLSITRALRLCRLVRLWHIVRMLSFLKELRRLLQMVSGCFKALFWSFLFLLLVMTTWAVIAVELLHPLMGGVAATGTWDRCERCGRSFSSVWHANITFFVTVVAGDSWGTIAAPMMEQHPWTAIIFVGSLMSLVFGVLNLIVAVVVDTFAESRQNDVASRASDLEVQEHTEKKVLAKIFDNIDKDRSGAVSLHELKTAAKAVPDFRHWLRVLDIAERELELLFDLLDEDQNGEIDPEEFIEAMFRFKNTNGRSNTSLVKNIVCRVDQETRAMRRAMDQVQVHPTVVPGSPASAGCQEPPPMEEALKGMLTEQDDFLRRTVEIAVRKASDVALEASLQAAHAAARDVMSAAAASSKSFAEGLRSRMLQQRAERTPSRPPADQTARPQPLAARLCSLLPPAQPLSRSLSPVIDDLSCASREASDDDDGSQLAVRQCSAGDERRSKRLSAEASPPEVSPRRVGVSAPKQGRRPPLSMAPQPLGDVCRQQSDRHEARWEAHGPPA